MTLDPSLQAEARVAITILVGMLRDDYLRRRQKDDPPKIPTPADHEGVSDMTAKSNDTQDRVTSWPFAISEHSVLVDTIKLLTTRIDEAAKAGRRDDALQTQRKVASDRLCEALEKVNSWERVPS